LLNPAGFWYVGNVDCGIITCIAASSGSNSRRRSALVRSSATRLPSRDWQISPASSHGGAAAT
jgi:hypothetical protein